ncbi:hypothetical protein M9N70_004957 [Escherichia coli]|nr:hypothetical protein [Escherichia coli]ELW6225703.1 hypothetical protein [Escherichia coli]
MKESDFLGHAWGKNICCGACMGQKYLLWGILGHDWDTLLHMNFADYYMTWQYNALILLKKTHALGRSLVIFKNSVSRS